MALDPEKPHPVGPDGTAQLGEGCALRWRARIVNYHDLGFVRQIVACYLSPQDS